MPENGQVTVESQLLGALNVLPSDVLLFPMGLLGFPECRRFALLRGGGDGCSGCNDGYSTLAFLLVDPFTVDSDYSFDVQPSQIADLGPSADVGLLSVVTLPANRHGSRPSTFGVRSLSISTTPAKASRVGRRPVPRAAPWTWTRGIKTSRAWLSSSEADGHCGRNCLARGGCKCPTSLDPSSLNSSG